MAAPRLCGAGWHPAAPPKGYPAIGLSRTFANAAQAGCPTYARESTCTSLTAAAPQRRRAAALRETALGEALLPLFGRGLGSFLRRFAGHLDSPYGAL